MLLDLKSPLYAFIRPSPVHYPASIQFILHTWMIQPCLSHRRSVNIFADITEPVASPLCSRKDRQSARRPSDPTVANKSDSRLLSIKPLKLLLSTYHPQAPLKNSPCLICSALFMPLCLVFLGLMTLKYLSHKVDKCLISYQYVTFLVSSHFLTQTLQLQAALPPNIRQF